MSLARYREKPKEWAAQVKEWTARVRAWWVATPVMAWWWRLLGRPQQVTFLDVDSVSMGQTASGVTLSTGTGTLTAQPGQSLEDQVEELRLRLNQLQEEISREKQDREQAIAAEREARREGLQAEAERRERQITDVRQEVEGLREATTGDLGLKAEGVVFLVAGIAFTRGVQKLDHSRRAAGSRMGVARYRGASATPLSRSPWCCPSSPI
jgi:TolA-binding protein